MGHGAASEAGIQVPLPSNGRAGYAQTSAALTVWKKTEELAFLGEVSCVPLQQALRHLQTAFTNYFAVVWSRPLPEGAEPSTVTVSRDSANRWFVSILCVDTVAPPDSVDQVVGKTRLVRENQTVVIEDLNVRNMTKNHYLARAISDAAWRQLRTMLEYKCDRYGRDLVVVDRWFPSTCSNCGTVTETLPLKVRKWKCACGVVHDRDINAARYVLAAGLAVSACGASVRPQWESS
ncbi:RNA-guided endonuclease InsQ/TnpB family protein [Actinomadura madurae]|uniref:RNA-guided endonuclease InsQ/TnpB family protein n=1 Tax=Actinomadura madurae TaxID=1993 RepID=UPI0039999FD6